MAFRKPKPLPIDDDALEAFVEDAGTPVSALQAKAQTKDAQAPTTKPRKAPSSRRSPAKKKAAAKADSASSGRAPATKSAVGTSNRGRSTPEASSPAATAVESHGALRKTSAGRREPFYVRLPVDLVDRLRAANKAIDNVTMTSIIVEGAYRQIEMIEELYRERTGREIPPISTGIEI